MQEAVPVGTGSMAAILGLEMAQVEELLRNVPNKNRVAQIANDNSPGQIVVSGHAEAIAWIIEQAKEIEKEQVIDAYKTSYISMMTAEQYYNKTFKNTDK